MAEKSQKSLQKDGLGRIFAASLPRTGKILEAGSGSTLAAANAVGYQSIGLEKDPTYYQMALRAIPALATLAVDQALSSPSDGGGHSGAKAAKRLKAGSY